MREMIYARSARLHIGNSKDPYVDSVGGDVGRYDRTRYTLQTYTCACKYTYAKVVASSSVRGVLMSILIFLEDLETLFLPSLHLRKFHLRALRPCSQSRLEPNFLLIFTFLSPFDLAFLFFYLVIYLFVFFLELFHRPSIHPLSLFFFFFFFLYRSI